MTEQIYDTTLHFLEPGTVKVSRNSFRKLIVEIGGEPHTGVRLTRAFPHTAPDLFISVADSDGKEIGVIEDISMLDTRSRETIEQELADVYFSPTILRITKLVQHYGATSWHVETDRGPQIVRVRERGDIRWLSQQRIVMSDVHGVRYEIPDIASLDESSRSLIEQET